MEELKGIVYEELAINLVIASGMICQHPFQNKLNIFDLVI